MSTKTVIVITVCALFVAAALPVWQGVAVISGGNMVYWTFPGFGKEFSIGYTHSVNKGRVHDFYRINGKELVLCKTQFRSYGAGIPEPEAGQTFKDLGGVYEISGQELHIASLKLFTGIIADHSIEHGNACKHFNDFIKPQSSVEITPKRLSIFSIIFKGYYV